MNSLEPIQPQQTRKLDAKEDRPKLGDWYWVRDSEDDDKPVLACVYHLASNHVQFEIFTRDGHTTCYSVSYEDVVKFCKIEPRWKEITEAKIEEKKLELADAVRQLTDMVKNAGLIQEENQPPTMLPSTVRRDPKEAKQSLLHLKETGYPAAKENVEVITKEITALSKNLYLPMYAEKSRMDKAMESIDKRLFALELYAGIGEQAIIIREGWGAKPETPIAVRQMLRFMDEETLIDYDKGGMDFQKLEDFDEWIAKDENFKRMCPEERCIVAFQVRRHEKDYGLPRTLGEAFQQYEMNQANKWTYLLIRNGERLARLAMKIDFSPRLIPFRDTFVEGFRRSQYNWDKHVDEYEDVTPQDFDYDDHVESRLNEIYEYNRIMFLIQGLLDRSKVFEPHPPINLADPHQVQTYFKAIFDEEDGLPGANPPKWEEYKTSANKGIRKGVWVWCNEQEEDREYSNWHGTWTKRKHDVARPRICEVYSVSRDKKKVTFRWSQGDRIKREWVVDHSRPVPNKPGWYYQKPLEWNLGERFGWQTVEIGNCFNIEAYTPGDYKKFLCDAYLKGAYLQWAPQLLSAEDWHRKKNEGLQGTDNPV